MQLSSPVALGTRCSLSAWSSIEMEEIQICYIELPGVSKGDVDISLAE